MDLIDGIVGSIRNEGKDSGVSSDGCSNDAEHDAGQECAERRTVTPHAGRNPQAEGEPRSQECSYRRMPMARGYAPCSVG